MADATLPCITCGRTLRGDSFPEETGNRIPSGGTQFSSHGHYGSTAWDPMFDPSELIINICDPCLVLLAELGHVLMGTPEIETTWTYKPWKLDAEYVERIVNRKDD